MTAYTLAELAQRLSVRPVGDPDTRITGLGSLASAGPGQLSHLSSAAYRAHLPGSRASAVILREEDLAVWGGAALVSQNPYLTFARASQLFDRPLRLDAGVHPQARVHAEATIDPTARVAAGAQVGPGCRIGAGVRIHANVVVSEDCEIGEASVLYPGVVLYANVRIGARCVIHGGAVIGADGFGFTPDERGYLTAIAQLGGVSIGADVSIGAGTSIDRGAIDDTVIEDGVKIDNQVQIGHNCRIGAHTVICGCVGIVGSTRIGRHCVLAGGVGIGGERPIEICDRVVVSGMTHVSASIAAPGLYSGGVIHNESRLWKRNALRFQKLDELSRRVARLEKQLAAAGPRAESGGGAESGNDAESGSDD